MLITSNDVQLSSQHESLIALPLPPSDKQNELVLLDPQWLAFQRNLYGPFRIAKTRIFIEAGQKWSALMKDGKRCDSLVDSDDIEPVLSPIDLISLLGHRISVMPWQSLVIRVEGSNISKNGMTFIEDINQESPHNE